MYTCYLFAYRKIARALKASDVRGRRRVALTDTFDIRRRRTVVPKRIFYIRSAYAFARSATRFSSLCRYRRAPPPPRYDGSRFLARGAPAQRYRKRSRNATRAIELRDRRLRDNFNAIAGASRRHADRRTRRAATNGTRSSTRTRSRIRNPVRSGGRAARNEDHFVALINQLSFVSRCAAM